MTEEESAANNFSESWIHIFKNLRNLSPFARVALSVRCAERALSLENLRFADENLESHMRTLNEIVDEIQKVSIQGANRFWNLQLAKRTSIDIYKLSGGSTAHAVASTMRSLDVAILMLDEESQFRAVYMAIQNSVSAREAQASAGRGFRDIQEDNSTFGVTEREWVAIYSDFRWLEENVRNEASVPQKFYERPLY